MFGPDLTCPGTKVNFLYPFNRGSLISPRQVHFIFRYKSPKTGEFEEKHLKIPPRPTIEKLTNLYTLVIKYIKLFSSVWASFSILL